MAAELGRAKHVPMEKLEAGMKVHRDVLGRGEKVLISAGEILSRKHVNQIKKWESREKPQGPALAKRNPKDKQERVRFGEFAGGWKPSHFNPQGVLVSSTLASGDDAPLVDKDPTASKAYQDVMKTKGTTIAMPAGPESTVVVRRDLRDEIQTLEETNADLGGDLHSQKPPMETVEEFTARRDALVADNKALIVKLKSAGARTEKAGGGKNGSSASTRTARAKTGQRR